MGTQGFYARTACRPVRTDSNGDAFNFRFLDQFVFNQGGCIVGDIEQSPCGERNFDIETAGISEEEVIQLLKSIIK